jgi:hypothetical protein
MGHRVLETSLDQPPAPWGQQQHAPKHPSPIQGIQQCQPRPKATKAVTPQLLQKMFKCSRAGMIDLRNTAPAIAANLVIGAFFFAKQACKYTTTPKPRKTKIIVLKGVVSQTATKANLDHKDKELSMKAEYVTNTFVDQKNGNKMDTQTQPRTDDEYLWPLLRFVSIVQWILRNLPNAGPDTRINTIRSSSQDLVTLITSDYIWDRLRHTCKTLYKFYSETKFVNISEAQKAGTEYFEYTEKDIFY